jgi:hypothetical protein
MSFEIVDVGQNYWVLQGRKKKKESGKQGIAPVT